MNTKRQPKQDQIMLKPHNKFMNKTSRMVLTGTLMDCMIQQCKLTIWSCGRVSGV